MPQATLTDRYAQAHAALEAVGQDHVLSCYQKLDESGKHNLLGQVEAIDWPLIGELVRSHVKTKPGFELPDNVEPAWWYPNDPADQADRYGAAWAAGLDLVRRGKVAAFTVAGGQGTRLGWKGPKGTFPATPVRGSSLFQCMAEYIQRMQQRCDAVIPWYIMTSTGNHADTIAFFEKHNYFNLAPENVMMFRQAMMPAIDSRSGEVLLEAPDSLALSPNGHGGSLQALYASGAIADMQRRGVEHICYVQVDNPIVRVVDPLFLGLHVQDGCEMSSKMLPKAYPKEKLGNFCYLDGRLTVIEYSDLPDELAEQRTPDGRLRFLAGSIAIHLIRTDFVERLNAGGRLNLPWHRADKKVPYYDLDKQQYVEPGEPNAVKLEMFVFDALPLCERSIIYETNRADEFAPIKNAQGVDSPETSKRAQVERAGYWLELHGVQVPRDEQGRVDATIEVSQATAVYPEDLIEAPLPRRVLPGSETVI